MFTPRRVLAALMIAASSAALAAFPEKTPRWAQAVKASGAKLD